MSTKKSNSKSDSSDKHTQALRDIQTRCAENKVCFECRQRGPTYVDVTVGSFVCSKCSGVLRGITPPHRIKSISMSSFTTEEVESIRTRGNSYNAKVWLGLYDFKARIAMDTKDDDSVRELIIQKYEKKRFYIDPSNIQHTVEPEPETSKTTNGPHHSPTSKFSSGLIGSTLQLHQQNRQQAQSAGIKPASIVVAAKVNLPPPAAEKTPSFPLPSVPLSKPSPVVLAAPPSQHKNLDPFGDGNVKSDSDFFGGGKGGSSSDCFANFEAADFYTSPTSNSMAATSASHSVNLDFGFHPMTALPAQPVTFETKQADSPKLALSSQEDRYAALKDLDNIFKSSVEVTPKPSEHDQPKPNALTSPTNRTCNPFATDFNSTQQLNTSPWPLSASPSGPGFAAAGFGGQKAPGFFPSPWDTQGSSSSALPANPVDFFNTKVFTNPWSETFENDNKGFGQFGSTNKKNPFL